MFKYELDPTKDWRKKEYVSITHIRVFLSTPSLEKYYNMYMIKPKTILWDKLFIVTSLEFVGFKFPKMHSLDLCSQNDGSLSNKFCEFSRQKAR